MIKVVIFDLDDTLYPEETFVKSGFLVVSDYINKRFGISQKAFFKELRNIFIHDGRGKIFDTALKSHGIYSRTLVGTLIKLYREHFPKIHLLDDTKMLLKFVSKNFDVAVVTDGMKHLQKNKVQALGVEEYASLVVYTGILNTESPKDITSFKKVLKFFRVFGDEVLFVGNNPYRDFVNAKKLHIHTVRIVTGPFRKAAIASEFEADYIIEKLEDVRDVIDIINNQL